jgi:hypothetical protein
MSERTEKGWNGYIFGHCPVQGCGLVDGYPWYFRARGESWEMEIADDITVNCECLPLVGMSCSGWIIEEDWGTWPEAGYMDEKIAWSFIENTISKFRANRLKYVSINEDK